ncbi:MAG: NADH-quinone oxidoreductase subunit NuoG [Buchnera aphidicola (Nurudea yanoniella)]
MAIISIDKKKYNVNDSENLLHACLSLGFNLPYFCWHPVLGSIGACRQCVVKQYHNDKDTIGRLVVSCMTPITDDLIISINDHEAVDFRKGIIELLMTNHPHDCPICEEGGNCHLQDMTVMAKHYIRRYRFSKRTHKNQNLGPFIQHEMNRCISCYRCVRYYKDYADGTDFGVFGISNNIYFGRFKEGQLESEFSGNLIDVCPTGVFTDKTQSETYTRKWDLQYAPSICQHCCIGCNISVGERYGKICKIENRYHGSINRYFLCDLGRFSYGYSNLKDRPKWSMHRINSKKQYVLDSIEQSIKLVSKNLERSSKIIGIGSSRASLESNYALQKLVGRENFSIGLLQIELDCIQLIEKILKDSGIYVPTLREIENYDMILVIGEDITQTSPMVALSVRQAIKNSSKKIEFSKKIQKWHSLAIKNLSQNIKNKLFVINTCSTKLDDISEISHFSNINDQVQLCFQIAHELDKTFSNFSNLSICDMKIVKKIVLAMLSSKNPLIISGSHCNSVELIQAVHNIAKALKNLEKEVGLVLLTSDSNSLGIQLLKGMSLEQSMDSVLKEKCDSIIILENDLFRYFPESKLLNWFSKIKNIIVIDHLNTKTIKIGKITLPASNSFESSGTIVNYEGRAQRFFQVYDTGFYNKSLHILDSWMWLHLIECKLYKKPKIWYTLDDVIHSMCSENYSLREIKFLAPNSSFRVFNQKLARSSHRSSGRTSMRSNINVHEVKQPEDKNSMFSFSMEGCQQIYKYSSYIPFAWVPGWNSIQAWNKFQKEINGELYCGDSGRRLFSYDPCQSIPWFDNISFIVTDSSYYVVPCYFLFGSEQLSQWSLTIQENIFYVAGIMNTQDAKTLSIQSGSQIEFICCKTKFTIIVHLSSKMKSKQLGLPLGYSNFPLSLSRKKVVELRKIIV